MTLGHSSGFEVHSNDFVYNIIQHSIDGILGFDKNLNINVWNPSLEIITGIKKEKVIGCHILDVLPFFKASGEDQNFYRALKGESFKKENSKFFIPASSKKGYFDSQYYPVYNSTGEIVGGMAVVHETTKRKKVEEELKIKNEQLIDAQHIAMMGSWLFDVDTGVIDWSNQVYKLFGVDRKDFSSPIEVWNKHVFPEDLDRIRGLSSESIVSGLPYESTYRITRKDGAVRTISTRAKPYINRAGKVTKLIGVCQDITNRIEAEEALKTLNNELEERVKERTVQLEESLDNFRSLLEAVPQMAWTNLSNGTVNYLNNLWYEYTGAKDLLSWKWEEYIFEEDYKKTLEKWNYSLQTGSDFEIEYRWIRKDGVVRWMLGRAKPIRNHQGEIILWVGTATDIHEQKAAQERLLDARHKLNLINLELSEKNEELLRINADLDNFIYTASHDLKAPISNIEGLVETISEELKLRKIEDLEDLFAMVCTSIEKFKSTIFELTEITKVQKNVTDEKNEDVFISELIEDIKFNLLPLIQEKKAEIIINLGFDKLSFSKKNLRSVLYNILSNALKYSSPFRTPTINITTSVDDNYDIISIKDNGLGMKSSSQSKIFSMFKRLHDHVEGSGVGLYIVKRIIDNAGGRIEVDSVEGKGSEFKIYLRRARPN